MLVRQNNLSTHPPPPLPQLLLLQHLHTHQMVQLESIHLRTIFLSLRENGTKGDGI